MTVVRRVLAALVPLATAAVLLPSVPAGADTDPGTALHLVTLRADAPAGTAEDLLEAVGAPRPVYRFTHALDGVAVALSAEQADRLRSEDEVQLVEQDERRPMAAAPDLGRRAGSPYAQGSGGRGVVVGIIDSGLWGESPLFASTPGLGPRRGFVGTCRPGERWPATACNGKVVGARWFVDGFGVDQLRSNSSLSARDDSGHGTQVASLAVGNAGVSVDLAGGSAGVYSGVAPQARVAVYKACWSAPDPALDGCSTADVVAAIDQAVADGVDVLNLSVAGGTGLDTVERALLGAAEADIAVVAAAGNTGSRAFAAHVSPWVTTVGGLQEQRHTGLVVTGSGARLRGAMLAPTGLGTRRVVSGIDARTAGATPLQARQCRPGSLDAAVTADAIVVCERGGVGRVDKSAAVARADGRGMILLNRPGGRKDVVADLHAVPTVHLATDQARRLRRELARGPVRARLARARGPMPAPRPAPSSPAGDPAGGVLKPDLVAPATSLLGAVPPDGERGRWDVLSGTSAAAAQVSGLVARLRSRHPRWSATEIRSALATASTPVAGRVARTGAGRAAAEPGGLVFEVGPSAYRRYLSGDLGSARLNTPSLMIRPSHRPVSRVVTNRTGQRRTWRVTTTGFARHDVRVAPASMTLDPGESRRFTVYADGSHRFGYDGGTVVWRTRGRTPVRVPVHMGR